MGSVKSVTKSGKNMRVQELTLADQSGARIQVSVWDNAVKYLQNIQKGNGVTFLGVSAMRDTNNDGKVKLNAWEHVNVLRGGTKVQKLTDLVVDESTLTTLTSTFVLAAGQPDVDIALSATEVCPTVCVALNEKTDVCEDRVFQCNRCTFTCLADKESVITPDGHFRVLPARMHDVTGSVQVHICAEALPRLFGFEEAEKLKEHLQNDKPLELSKHRFNVRSLLRKETGPVTDSPDKVTDSPVKRYIVQVARTPLESAVSSKALSTLIGLHEVEGDLVLPVPVMYVRNEPLVGMCVSKGSVADNTIGLHRALLLVKGGADDTKLSPVGPPAADMQEQSYKVTAPDTSCLLSKQRGTETKVTLVGFCSFKEMLHYRLDQEQALVTVSAVTKNADNTVTATMEHIVKVSAIQSGQVSANCLAEYECVVEGKGFDADAPPMKKLKTLSSEPITPEK